LCGFTEILFGGLRNQIDVVQMIEPTHPSLIMPGKPDQLDPRRNHLISVAVEGWVDQHIASSRLDTPVISRFDEAARQYHRCIGMKMPMPRQAEAAWQRLYTRRDAAKTRVVDRY